MRFLFSTAVWGADYVRNFLNLSLPTQLAEGNLDGFPWISDSVYQIYTTERDAEVIRRAPIYERLTRKVATDFVYIDRVRGANKYNRISLCQMEAVRRTEGFDAIFFLYPDFIWSKGCLERAANKVVEGHDAVVCPVPRVRAEDLAAGLFEADEFVTESGDGRIVSLPARNFVALARRHMHPMMNGYFWNAEHFSEFPSYLMWEVPNQGMLIRCYHLHPIVLRVPRDDPNFFLRFSVSLDEEYLPRLFKSGDRIYFVTDSDELALCSLTPADPPLPNRDRSPRASVALMAQWAEEYAALLHRKFVEMPYRWHDAAIEEDLWAGVERRSQAVVGEIGNRLQVPDALLRLEDPSAYQARKRRLRRFANWRRPKFGPPRPLRFIPPAYIPSVPDHVLTAILVTRLHKTVILRLYRFATAIPGYDIVVRRGFGRLGWWQRMKTKFESEQRKDIPYSYLPTPMIVQELIRRFRYPIARAIGLYRYAEKIRLKVAPNKPLRDPDA